MAIDDLNLVYMNLESVISDRFAKYSKYIIQDRALPDARDGLKPVQRRILYAMFKEGNHFNKPYRKSAKSVGVVIGNYHPHGDSSVYEAMVRMSQSFKLNEPLIDMHGNNGSIDGDPAAAMRYTEARLSAIAMNLLENVDKNTVDFAPNFDDTDFEPIVLPAYFPNLLVNGSTGISAGYATDIPSHNLAEVIDATVHRINNPACDLSDILEFVKGPDFCTGGIIQGAKELEKAYRSGKGRIVVRSKVKVEVVKNIKVINIYELPYDVNKADLVRKLEEIKYDKIFDSIIAVRDESDRDGLSIIIELKKQADENLILNYLYKNTNLQVYYNFNMVAIVNKSPKLLGIIEILDCYIAHQKDVLTKKTMYELELAKARLHIVEGLIKSIDVIDEIITIIRASENRSTSAKNLVERFDFTKLQAEAIVDLRLYRLSNTDINTLNEEFEKLTGMVKYFNSILSDVNILNTEIINKMLEIKEKFKKDRMTAIETDIQEIVIDKQQLITDSEVMISISRDGYIKRATPRSYSSNSDEIIRKENDFIICINSASTLDKLVVLFDNGTYGFIPVFELIETKWKDFGKHISNYVSGINGDKVINAFLINDFNTNKSLISVTKNGNIKQTSISEFEVTRYSKALKYINLKNDDVVVSNRIGNINDDVILMSKKGYVLRYSLTHVSPTSLKSAGIKAMRLTDDELVSIELVDEFSNEQLFVVFENGNTKRMRVSEIMINNRATKGNLYVKAKKTNVDNVLSTHLVSNVDTVFVLDSLDNVTLINPNDTNFSNNELGLRKSVSLADNDYLVDSVIIEDIFVSNNDKQENSNVEKIDSNKKVVDEIKEEKVENDTNKSDLELELESLLKDEHKEEEILEQVQLDFNDIDL